MDPALLEGASVTAFLDALASPAATPGGGSATALGGAVAAALVSMVCGLTQGGSEAAAVREEMAALGRRAQSARERLRALIDEDMRAFDAVMRAYALPRADEAQRSARSRAIQAALREATLVPLQCARLCGEVVELSGLALRKGHVNAVGEAGVAALVARAALRGAALNVRLNAGSIKDAAFVESTLEQLEEITRACEGDEAGIERLVTGRPG